MDNRRLDITSVGHQALKHAMAIAFADLTGGATHWAVVQGCLVLFWAAPYRGGELYRVGSETVEPVQFLVPMAPEGAAAATMEWLESDRATMPPEPDIDGHCKPGWRVFNHDTEGQHLFGIYQVLLAVQPVWAQYHK